ncbi:MAG TPA: hypothetical protein VGX00_01860 [Thermoplasmata archaeon]|nr:hypothetical protein [Thermoplasmata archaeon]
MAENRQKRIEQLGDAYSAYMSLLKTRSLTSGPNEDFRGIIQTEAERKEMALKLAFGEVARAS